MSAGVNHTHARTSRPAIKLPTNDTEEAGQTLRLGEFAVNTSASGPVAADPVAPHGASWAIVGHPANSATTRVCCVDAP